MHDAELLHRFAIARDQAAFAELVRRHVDLVYAAALRHLAGDRHRAEDVAQLVFIDLARKAPELAGHPCIAGWLYASTRFTAINTVRREQRRVSREQEAETMHENASLPENDWEQIRPLIDDAMHDLDEPDRQSVLLRFFGQQTFHAIGAQLGLSENAAQKRVDRALDRLNAALARRGITSTSAALASALAHSAVAAPTLLAARVTAAAVSGAATAAVGVGTFTFMSTLKLVSLTAAAIAGGFLGGAWYQSAAAARQAAQHDAEVRAHLAQLEERVRAEAKRADSAEADTARLLTAVEQARDAAKVAPSSRAQPVTATASSYVVRPGDTLKSIAQRLAVSPESLQALNVGLDFRRMMVGQQITIPPGASVVATPSPETRTTLNSSPIPEDAAYIVVAGDSAVKIARNHGLRLEQIRELNPDLDWTRVKVGQRVRVR